MVAAVAADDLERIGVAALRPARHHAGGLAPQDHGPVLPGLNTSLHACPCAIGCHGSFSLRHVRGGPQGPLVPNNAYYRANWHEGQRQAAAQAAASARCASGKCLTSPGVIQPNSVVM